MGVGVDGDVGRQLAPITDSPLLAPAPLDVGGTPATRSAPSSTRPLSRNDGFPIASRHSSDGKWCFDGAPPPVAGASEEFWSVVTCRLS